ncbi:MAG: Flp pilus assembly protein CpaB, partial [Elusimicrobia bacterium RIFOXYB2_FULL_48_7]
MNRKKQVIVSALVSVFTALMVVGYLAGLENKYKTGSKKVSVLVAREYIDQGSMIKPELVEEIKVPQEYIQPKAIRGIKEITGENNIPLYMAVVPVLAGEQILTTKLFGLGQETGLAAVIPTDKRAFSIACERDKIRGIIRPGNKVDIIATLDYYNDRGQKFEEARTILQNITVLSVGKQVLGMVKPAAMK